VAKGSLDRDDSFEGKEPQPGSEARPFLHQGDSLRDKRQWHAALVEYRKALAAEPDNGLLLLRAARASEALDDFAAAEEYLRQAVGKNPFFVPAYITLGRLLYDDGRYDDAQKILQEGLEIQPSNPRLHETLGLISMDVGDIPSARRSIELAIRFDPNNADLRDVLRRMPKGRGH
jgi:tetratricopeptide (TPR) repeat protein